MSTVAKFFIDKIMITVPAVKYSGFKDRRMIMTTKIRVFEDVLYQSILYLTNMGKLF